LNTQQKPRTAKVRKKITWHAVGSALYLAVVLALGMWAFLAMIERPGPPNWGSFTILLLMACAATPLKVQLPGVDRSLSLSFLFTFAAITEQPAILVLVIAAAVQAFDVLLGREKEDTTGLILFNFASAACSILVTSLIYSYLIQRADMPWLVASAAAAAGYFLLVSGTSALRIGIELRQNPLRVWNEKFFWTSPIYMMAPLGVTVIRLLLDARSYVDTLLGLTVIASAYFYVKTYFPRLNDRQDHAQRLAEIRQKALETLAVAIEAKDGSTAGHLQRVKLYATRLGEQLGCSEEEIRTLKLAAVLHDVGKVGVPDYILKKPSRLTEHEFDEISHHVAIGAEIVSAMQFPEPVEQIVLSHHEHWDGSGYPRRLFGPEIPRLARILTVVDCFDALISERPYRRALSIEEAVELMGEQRGKIFDPSILDTFLTELPSYLEELERDLELERALKAPVRQRKSVKQTWITEPESRASLRSHTLQRLTEAPEQLVAFYDILRTLGADLNIGKSLHECLQILRNAIPSEKAGIFALHGDKYVLMAADGIPDHCIGRMVLSAEHGLLAHTVHTRVPMVADAVPGEAPGSAVPHYLEDVRATLAAPLIFEEQVAGVIMLCSTQAGAFDEDQGLFLSLITEKLAATLLSGQKLERMQLEAQTDQVTGLPNARAAFQQLEIELHRAQRDGSKVGVLFMDINGLKPVNDSYGHAAGDRLLIETGLKLQGCLRSFDFLGRIGGDEFLAVLPGVTTEALDDQIEHLKSALGKTRIEVAHGIRTKPMVSVGASVYPDDASGADDLVYLSDQRMYEDKLRAKQQVASQHIERIEQIESGEPAEAFGSSEPSEQNEPTALPAGTT
jgi:diguanylate cyclase (GGDEF)-like protein/putative nucleotidyltransferase with HDIG domain